MFQKEGFRLNNTGQVSHSKCTGKKKKKKKKREPCDYTFAKRGNQQKGANEARKTYTNVDFASSGS